MFWGFKTRKKYREIMKENTKATLRKMYKKVYCGDCTHFRKEKNTWYYLAGNGGQMGNEFNRYCDHPTNLREVDASYDTFEKREVRTRSVRQTPEVLNFGNKCPVFKPKTEQPEPDWEK